MPTINYSKDVVQPRYPDWDLGPDLHDLNVVHEVAQTLDSQNGANVVRDDDTDIALRAEQAPRIEPSGLTGIAAPEGAVGAIGGPSGAQAPGAPTTVPVLTRRCLIETTATFTASTAGTTTVPTQATAWTRHASITATKLATYGSINTTEGSFDAALVQPASCPDYYFEVVVSGTVVISAPIVYGTAPGVGTGTWWAATGMNLSCRADSTWVADTPCRFKFYAQTFDNLGVSQSHTIRLCVAEMDNAATRDILIVDHTTPATPSRDAMALTITTAGAADPVSPVARRYTRWVSAGTYRFYTGLGTVVTPYIELGQNPPNPFARYRLAILDSNDTLIASLWLRQTQGLIEVRTPSGVLHLGVAHSRTDHPNVNAFLTPNGSYVSTWVAAANSAPVKIRIYAVFPAVLVPGEPVPILPVELRESRGQRYQSTQHVGPYLNGNVLLSTRPPSFIGYWVEIRTAMGISSSGGDLTYRGWVPIPDRTIVGAPNASRRAIGANTAPNRNPQLIEELVSRTNVSSNTKTYALEVVGTVASITDPVDPTETVDPETPETPEGNRVIEGVGGLAANSATHNTDEGRYINVTDSGWVKIEVDCGETGETTSADFYLEAGIMHNIKVTRIYDTLNDTTLTPKIPPTAGFAVIL